MGAYRVTITHEIDIRAGNEDLAAQRGHELASRMVPAWTKEPPSWYEGIDSFEVDVDEND